MGDFQQTLFDQQNYIPENSCYNILYESQKRTLIIYVDKVFENVGQTINQFMNFPPNTQNYKSTAPNPNEDRNIVFEDGSKFKYYFKTYVEQNEGREKSILRLNIHMNPTTLNQNIAGVRDEINNFIQKFQNALNEFSSSTLENLVAKRDAIITHLNNPDADGDGRAAGPAADPNAAAGRADGRADGPADGPADGRGGGFLDFFNNNNNHHKNTKRRNKHRRNKTFKN